MRWIVKASEGERSGDDDNNDADGAVEGDHDGDHDGDGDGGSLFPSQFFPCSMECVTSNIW